MIKNSRQKFRYLENEKNLQGEKKAFSIAFQGLAVPKNCLRPESVPESSKNFVCFCLTGTNKRQKTNVKNNFLSFRQTSYFVY